MKSLNCKSSSSTSSEDSISKNDLSKERIGPIGYLASILSQEGPSVSMRKTRFRTFLQFPRVLRHYPHGPFPSTPLQMSSACNPRGGESTPYFCTLPQFRK